jgi:hypothetical protein
VPRTEIDTFVSQAQSGDYNRLLTTVMEWFDTTDSNSDEDDEDDELHDYGDYGSE